MSIFLDVLNEYYIAGRINDAAYEALRAAYASDEEHWANRICSLEHEHTCMQIVLDATIKKEARHGN